VFFPSSVQDILDMGLHAFAMSRFSGVWSGMKTIQEVVESSPVVQVDPDRVKIVLPEDFEMPPGGLHIRWPDAPLEQEARLFDYKWYAALAYVRANGSTTTSSQGPNDRFGIIASGKAYNDTRQALVDLGLDDDTCRALGIRVHKVNVVWPLEATITRDFAQGLQEILVVEEKRQVIEYQLKEELYNWRPTCAPTCWASSTTRRQATRRRRVEHAQPQPELAAARQGRPDAGHHRQGHRQAAEEAGRGPRHRAPHGPAPGRVIAARASAAGRAEGRHRRPRALVLQRLPAQHQHPRARRLARGGRHRLPLHDGVDGPQHQHLHARWAARACPGSARRRSPTTRTSSPTWATAPTSTAACWPSARASRRA
jgi:hypothetical protein